MTAPHRRLRLRFQGRAVVLLAVVWVMLWGEASLLNILYGLLLGWLVTLVFWLPPIRYYGKVRPLRVLVLLVTVLRDLATASVQLAVVALSPRPSFRPGIIRVRLRSNSDLYQVAVAQLISIVPGTLVVEVDRNPRVLYLHVFDLPDAAAVEHQKQLALALERRVVRAFGSPAEVEAVS